MPTPSNSVTFWAVPYGTSSTVAVGNVMIPTTDATAWLVSTTAARGTRRSEGIAVTSYGGSGIGTVEIWQVGTIDATISGLAAGSASWVRCSATGTIERVTPTTGDDIIGYAEADGRVHLAFGTLTAGIVNGSSPTGTGIPHVVAGVTSAAASLIVNADVSTGAAIALTKLGAPTGTGFATVTAGAWDAAALSQPLSVAKGGTGLAALPGSSPQFLFNSSGTLSATGNLSYNLGGLELNSSGFIAAQAGGASIGLFRLKAIGSIDFLTIDDGGGGNRAALINVNSSTTVISLGIAAYNTSIAGAQCTVNGTIITTLQTGSIDRIYCDTTNVKLALPVCGNSGQNFPFRFKKAAITQATTADTTLTASQYECPVLEVTGTPGGAFNIIAPNTTDSFFIVSNGTPSALTIKKSGGTGIVIATLKTAQVRHNGTDYVRVTADA